jgi:hypothetical protein
MVGGGQWRLEEETENHKRKKKEKKKPRRKGTSYTKGMKMNNHD